MIESRLSQVLVVFGVLNLLVVSHLVRLQVVERDHWEAKGEDLRSRRRFTLPLRGSIRLEDGTEVARSEHRYDLLFEPGVFRDHWPPGALTIVLRKLEEKQSFWVAHGRTLAWRAHDFVQARNEVRALEGREAARGSRADVELKKALQEAEARKEALREALRNDIADRRNREAEARARVLGEVVQDPRAAWRRLLDLPVLLFLPGSNEKKEAGATLAGGAWDECLLDGYLSDQVDVVLGPRTVSRLRNYVRRSDPARARWHTLGQALGVVEGSPRYRRYLAKLEAEARAFRAVSEALGGHAELAFWQHELDAENNARVQLQAVNRQEARAEGHEAEPGWWLKPVALLRRGERMRYRKIVRDHLGRARFPIRELDYDAVVELDRAAFERRLEGFRVNEYSGRRTVHALAPHVIGRTGQVPGGDWLKRLELDFEDRAPPVSEVLRTLADTRAVFRANVEFLQQQIVSRSGMRDPDDAQIFLKLEDALLEKPHAGDRDVGLSGVEHVYDERLRGRRGIRRYVHMPGMKRPLLINDTLPRDGRDVTLTLDLKMQRVAEQLLAEDRASRGPDAYPRRGGGALVALDPRSGAIRVLATDPSYDPESLKDPEVYARLMDEKLTRNHPLSNRALEPRMPGSVFKVFTALAGFRSGVTSPATTFVCWGRTGKKPGCSFADHRYGGVRVNLREALAHSCNAYFAHVGEEMVKAGKGRVFFELFQTLGLKELPIGLTNPGLRESVWQEIQKAAEIRGRMRNMGIGQAPVQVSPLQMAALFGMIGRGGLWQNPYLVCESCQAVRPEVRLVAEAHARALWPGLVDVVTHPRGTAANQPERRKLWNELRTSHPGHVFAGKTGTATFGSRARPGVTPPHAWFACFAGTRQANGSIDVEVAVAVFLECRGLGGGGAAAPIAARFLKAYLDRDARGRAQNAGAR